jgi:hypothetical protein
VAKLRCGASDGEAGVSHFPRSKQSEFSGQKPAIEAKDMAKNPPLMGHFPVGAAPNEQASP